MDNPDDTALQGLLLVIEYDLGDIPTKDEEYRLPPLIELLNDLRTPNTMRWEYERQLADIFQNYADRTTAELEKTLNFVDRANFRADAILEKMSRWIDLLERPPSNDGLPMWFVALGLVSRSPSPVRKRLLKRALLGSDDGVPTSEYVNISEAYPWDILDILLRVHIPAALDIVTGELRKDAPAANFQLQLLLPYIVEKAGEHLDKRILQTWVDARLEPKLFEAIPDNPIIAEFIQAAASPQIPISPRSDKINYLQPQLASA